MKYRWQYNPYQTLRMMSGWQYCTCTILRLITSRQYNPCTILRFLYHWQYMCLFFQLLTPLIGICKHVPNTDSINDAEYIRKTAQILRENYS